MHLWVQQNLEISWQGERLFAFHEKRQCMELVIRVIFLTLREYVRH
jgi:hypothetical protein